MVIGSNLLRGLALVSVLAAPARAECFGNCGYGAAIALVVGGGLALVGLVVFALVKLRLGWLLKWLFAALVILTLVPPTIRDWIHSARQRAAERVDFAGPLPRMDNRRALFLVLDSNAFSGCPFEMQRHVEEESLTQDVLMVDTWSLEGIDFTKPLALADLPVLRQTIRTGMVGEGADAQAMPVTERSLLLAEDRKAAVAGVDYLVISDCYGQSGLSSALRLNPALQGTDAPLRIELAMAPLDGRAGTLDLTQLTFDLLDVQYDGVTPGFLIFARERVGGINREPYDRKLLQDAFCIRSGGGTLPNCVY